jgi:UDP:flavonoid glycosyltransferase YjiC (YdhE family)
MCRPVAINLWVHVFKQFKKVSMLAEHGRQPVAQKREGLLGVGRFLRAATVTAAKVRAAVERVMREEEFTQAAQRVAASFARFDSHARFRAVIDDVTTQSHGTCCREPLV